MTEPTPEAAFRAYWINTGIYAALFFPLAGFLTYLRTRGLTNGVAISAWSIGGTLAVAAGLLLIYAIPADRFYRRIERENPEAVVFAATRAKFWDAAISKLTEDRFNGSYLSAIVADADSLRILSRKGGTITIAWGRVLDIAGSSTRDFRIDYPCVAIDLRTDAGTVRLPLRATNSAWASLFLTNPKTIRDLQAKLQALLEAAVRDPRHKTDTDRGG